MTRVNRSYRHVYYDWHNPYQTQIRAKISLRNVHKLLLRKGLLTPGIVSGRKHSGWRMLSNLNIANAMLNKMLSNLNIRESPSGEQERFVATLKQTVQRGGLVVFKI